MDTQATQAPRLAAIYARVSTEEQTTGEVASLPTQVAECKAKATKLGLTVATIESGLIVQETHSGSDLRWQGTQFMALVRRAQRGEFTDLICLDIDRFCRGGPEAYFEQMGYFTEVGVTIHWVMFDVPKDMPFAKTITTARSEAAQWWRDKIVEASVRVRTAYAEQGNLIPGNTPPFGWLFVEDPTRKTKRGRPLKIGLTPDPDTSGVLLHMYQHVASGGSIGALRRWLEAQRIPTPGKALTWHEQTIRRILHNPTNWGERRSFYTRHVPHAQGVRRPVDAKSRMVRQQVPRDEQYEVDPGIVQPISGLTRDLAMRALDYMAEHQAQRTAPVGAAGDAERAERALLFGGMVRCGTCGHGVRVKHNPYNWLYVCFHTNTVHRGEPCVSMSVNILDPKVWDIAVKAVRDPAFFERLVRQTDTVAGPAAQVRAQEAMLADAEQERTILRKHRNRLDPDDPDNAGLLADIEDDLRRVLARIKDLNDALQASRTTLANEEAQRASLTAFRDYAASKRDRLDSMTRLEKHQLLRALHTRVRLRNAGRYDRVAISFDIRHLPGAAEWLDPDLLTERQTIFFNFSRVGDPWFDTHDLTTSLEILQIEGEVPFSDIPMDPDKLAETGFATEEEYNAYIDHTIAEQERDALQYQHWLTLNHRVDTDEAYAAWMAQEEGANGANTAQATSPRRDRLQGDTLNQQPHSDGAGPIVPDERTCS